MLKLVALYETDVLKLLPLTADPTPVPGMLWFRSDLQQLRWSPDGSRILTLDPPTSEGARVSFSQSPQSDGRLPPDLNPFYGAAHIIFERRTTDPPLVAGRVWFRSDRGLLLYSFDGVTRAIIDPDECESGGGAQAPSEG